MGRFLSGTDPVKAIVLLLMGGSVTVALLAIFLKIPAAQRSGLKGVVIFGALVLAALLIMLLMYLIARAVSKSKGSLLMQRLFPEHDPLVDKIQAGLRAVAQQMGRPLQEVPFFVFVGEPKGGKTEAVRHGAYDWHVGPSLDRREVQGVGGTEGMDWWFTLHGAILDVAGALWEQATIPQQKQWQDFLSVLKKGRPYVPINGVVLCIPVDSLLKVSDENYADFVRKTELTARQCMSMQEALGIRFPIFVLITKSDLIPGFKEFCREIPFQMRSQVLGWSNRDDLNEPFDPRTLGARLRDGLLRPIRDRQLLLIEKCPAPLNRNRVGAIDALYLFPSKVDELLPRIQVYLDKLFAGGVTADKPPFMRGIYFTSAMEMGTALDPQLASMLGKDLDEEFIRQRNEQAKLSGKSKTQLFLGDFLANKMFVEVGLVTTRRRPNQWRRAAAIWLTATATAAALVLLTCSFILGKQFRDQIGDEVKLWQRASKDLFDGYGIAFREGKQFVVDPQRASLATDLHAKLRGPLTVPFVFRTLCSSEGLQEERVKAFREVYWWGIAESLLNGAQQRLEEDTASGRLTPGDLPAVAELLRAKLDLDLPSLGDPYLAPLSAEGMKRLTEFILARNTVAQSDPKDGDVLAAAFALRDATLGVDMFKLIEDRNSRKHRSGEEEQTDYAQEMVGTKAAAKYALEMCLTPELVHQHGQAELRPFEELKEKLAAVRQAEKLVLGFPKRSIAKLPEGVSDWTSADATEAEEEWRTLCAALATQVKAWEESENALGSGGAAALEVSPVGRWGTVIDARASDLSSTALRQLGLPAAPGGPEAKLPEDQRDFLKQIREYANDACRSAAQKLKEATEPAVVDELHREIRLPVAMKGTVAPLAAVKARLNGYERPVLLPAEAGPLTTTKPWEQVNQDLAAVPPLPLLDEANRVIKTRVTISIAQRNRQWFRGLTGSLPKTAEEVGALVEALEIGGDVPTPPDIDIPWCELQRGDPVKRRYRSEAALAVLKDRYVVAKERLDKLDRSVTPVLEFGRLQDEMREGAKPFEAYVMGFEKHWFADIPDLLREVHVPEWRDAVKHLSGVGGDIVADQCAELFTLLGQSLRTSDALRKALGTLPAAAPADAKGITDSVKQLGKRTFRRSCENCWSNWAKLGTDVASAAATIASLPPDGFLRAYCPFGLESEAPVDAYWRTVSAQLLGQLAAARAGQMAKDVDEFAQTFLRFPLSPPDDHAPLTVKEVCSAAELARRFNPLSAADLESLGGGKRTGQPDIDATLDKLLVHAVDGRAGVAGLLAGQLCNSGATFRVWLKASGDNSAVDALQFLKVKDGAGAPLEIQLPNQGRLRAGREDVLLYEKALLVADSPLRLEFCRYRDEKAPTHVIILDGPWRILWLAHSGMLPGPAPAVRCKVQQGAGGGGAWTATLTLPDTPALRLSNGMPLTLTFAVQVNPPLPLQ